MALKQQLVGAVLERFVHGGPKLAGRYARLRGDHALVLYLQLDDPHGWLLGQRLNELLPDRTVEVVAVPAAGRDVNPEPELRLRWAVRDAWTLATYYRVAGPERSDAEVEPDSLVLAQAILLFGRDPTTQLPVALEVCAALWAGDHDELEALALRYGRVSAGRIAGKLEESAAELVKRGHYQGSMLRFEGEWFWGIDRISHLLERLGHTESPLQMRPESELPSVEEEQALLLDDDGTAVVEYFASFRSPYSFLAVERALALRDLDRVSLKVTPVLPMVMRGLPVPLTKRLYIVTDAAREARRLGLPFGRLCDPVGLGAERCLAAFCAADRAGLGAELLQSAGRGVWTEALDVATDRDLRLVCERAGVSWTDVQSEIRAEAWRELAEANRVRLFEAGLWGVPCFSVGRVGLWGQDRLDLLKFRLLRALG